MTYDIWHGHTQLHHLHQVWQLHRPACHCPRAAASARHVVLEAAGAYAGAQEIQHDARQHMTNLCNMSGVKWVVWLTRRREIRFVGVILIWCESIWFHLYRYWLSFGMFLKKHPGFHGWHPTRFRYGKHIISAMERAQAGVKDWCHLGVRKLFGSGEAQDSQ